VELGWLLLALVVWALGFLFVLALMRMSGDQDRAARRISVRPRPPLAWRFSSCSGNSNSRPDNDRQATRA
jgi:hypothetical protein